IKEHNFWKNYFYRVSLIKQSSQLTSIAAESGESTSRSSSRRSSTDKDSSQSQAVNIAGDDKKQNKKDEEDDMLPPDSPTNEFVSDAFNSDLDHDDIQKGMKQLGMEKTDGQN
uniref:Synapse-associated protein 1-like n=1 Tax=Saccoglossus kowalevskii TaxID=10224 RepID=A0ABM0MLN8_SACKO